MSVFVIAAASAAGADVLFFFFCYYYNVLWEKVNWNLIYIE